MILPILKRLGMWIPSLCLTLLLNPSTIHQAQAGEVLNGEDFILSERIVFSVKWSFIPLIKSFMETHRLGNGTDPILYRLTHQAASNAFWNDRIASIIDSKTLLPFTMETIVREGRKTSVQRIVFQREIGKALLSHQEPGTGRDIVDHIDITKTGMDPLSAFYNLRRRVSPSTPFLELSGITGLRRFILEGRLVAEEKIRVPGGSFNTYRVECSFKYWPKSSKPSTNEIKANETEDNRFTLWVSQDDHRFPVQIRYHLPVGSLWIRAISLESHEPAWNPAHPKKVAIRKQPTAENRKKRFWFE
jgi:hypothetical protein